MSFSADGTMLAAVGGNPLDSLLLVFDWEKEKLIAHRNCSSKRTYSLNFNPTDNSIVWTGKNEIKFFNVSNRNISEDRAIISSGGGDLQSFYNCVFSQTNGNAYVGCYDGNLYEFKGNRLSNQIKIHKGAVLCSYQLKNGFVTGGKDGYVRVWQFDPKTKTGFTKANEMNVGFPVGSVAPSSKDLIYIWGHKTSEFGVIDMLSKNYTKLMDAHAGKSASIELWGLDVIPDTNLFISAGDDGRIIIWNKESKRTVASIRSPKLDFRAVTTTLDGEYIIASTIRGDVFVYSTKGVVQGDDTPLESLSCGSEEIIALRVSPDGTQLAVGSKNNKLYIFDINRGWKKNAVLEGHTSYVTALDWSADGKFIQSTSGDYELLYWDIENSDRVTMPTQMRDVQWHTQTCPLGWGVRGIWDMRTYNDGTDINAVATCFERKLLVSVDDFGDVNLLRYPTLINQPPRLSYIGHCSHTTNVKFSSDNMHLFTAGGGDLTIFQWKIVRNQQTTGSGEPTVPRNVRRKATSKYVSDISEPEPLPQSITGRRSALYETTSNNYGSKPGNEISQHQSYHGINGNFTRQFTGGMYRNFSLNTNKTRHSTLRDPSFGSNF
eukprot:CAMPEP_0117427778 /NCGR_PEP_ID=MMETSP0758-20121206/7582_1 /TAXON_ID=63605 /ORGANISM="Percolomonas cosmopolitus, Strain AE-1 (ATCC 50343)" /LENGTH=603 /DNA_ID=CAMNT_0005213667 /DNA_START=386 /DNA_END=2197 /DNA_ORIENTATION=+